MSNPTELPDLDLNELEAIALAATPGPWKGDRYDGTIKYDLLGKDDETVIHGDNGNSDHGPFGIENEEDENYLLAFHPATALRLIELARRAQPEGEAPQADDENIEADAYMAACDEMELWQKKRAKAGLEIGTEGSLVDGIGWLYGYIEKLEAAATLSPLCGAQHAESCKEIAVFADDGTEPDWSSYAAAEAAQQAAAPGALDEQALRDMFERDAATHLGIDHAINRTSFQRDDDGGYQLAKTRRLFAFWKAAREAATPSAPGTPEAPAEPDMLWQSDDSERFAHGPDEFAEDYAADCLRTGETEVVEVDCATRASKRAMSISVVDKGDDAYKVEWKWVPRAAQPANTPEAPKGGVA
jgi:hypothetical protein